MKGSVAFFWASLLFGLTGYSVSRTGGLYHFHLIALWGLSFFFFCYFEKYREPKWQRAVEILVALILFVFLARLFLRPLGWRTSGSLATESIRRPVQWTVLASLLFLVIYGAPKKIGLYLKESALELLLFAIAISHTLIQISVVRRSGDPHIDVFSNTQLAAQYLWLGQNPYAQNYPDIYQGQMPYPSGFFYPPGILLWVAPFFRLFGDIRYGLVAANFLLIPALWFLMANLRIEKTVRSLWLLIWISFPVHAQLVECGYNESVICLGITLGLIAFRQKKPGGTGFATGILWGFLLMLKQYLVPLVGLVTFDVILNKKKRSLPFLIGLLAAAGLVFLPFFLWNPSAFLFSTVSALAHQPLRTDAFSLPALIAHEFQWVVPSPILVATAGLTTLEALRRVFRRRGSIWAPVIGLYGIIFFLGKQAFINYYLLFAFTLFLFLVYELAGKTLWNQAQKEADS